MRQQSRTSSDSADDRRGHGPDGIVPGWPSIPNRRFARRSPAPPRRRTSSPGVFRQYCVGCHNERMKANFGNLSLESVDPADVSATRETLEKVVRKLRKGQMPPLGRPRPDAADARGLRRLARNGARSRTPRRQPNPGRVVSRRLNRAEYVNAVYDLLGLEVNGSELLPSDMAGFGFDNNADVLSITPGADGPLHHRGHQDQPRRAGDSGQSRRRRRATRVGDRHAAGRCAWARRCRSPSFGGLAVKHTFPLDGEYAFQLRLTRDQDGLINGIMAEHVIELRVDRALVKRFTIGGKYKEPDPRAADRGARRRRARGEGSQVLHQRGRCADGARAGESRARGR